MLLSKLVYVSIPFVLTNILVNTIGVSNTFVLFLGLATLYGYHLHFKREYDELQDFITENTDSLTRERNIINEIDGILANEENDCSFLKNAEEIVEEVVEEIIEDVHEVVEEISPILQEVADEMIEQIVDQKIENIAPEVLESVDEIIEEVVPESIAPIVEEVINESAPVVEEVVEEAVAEIVEGKEEGKEEGKWFSIGPWSN